MIWTVIMKWVIDDYKRIRDGNGSKKIIIEEHNSWGHTSPEATASPGTNSSG